MKEQSGQTFLAAQWGAIRVTIGLTPPDELRRLSNARLLTCPGCGSSVILHAGTVRAHHFAHLPGAVCTAPQTEPETEEHRAGKLLIAQWLRICLPAADIIVEAHIPETNQRADVLVIVSQQQRIAIEYQCANMTAREWRRRHELYRSVDIQDLWLLGGSRLLRETAPVSNSNATGQQSNPKPAPANISLPTATPAATILRTHELERGLLWDGAPLLFLDAIGEQLPIAMLARFRPNPDAQAMRPAGRLVTRLLLELPFPFALLDWPNNLQPDSPNASDKGKGIRGKDTTNHQPPATNHQLWNWLAQRHRITPLTLDGFFGLPIKHEAVFACENRAWQAAIYYRFIHRRVEDRWWLAEVETWTRAYLPLTFPVNLKHLQSALAEYQELLAAAGFLSLPRGYNRANATVTADLMTLPAPPDPQETLRLARYRRTLLREAAAEYIVK